MVPSQRDSKSLSRTFSFTIPGWWNDLPTPILNHCQSSSKKVKGLFGDKKKITKDHFFNLKVKLYACKMYLFCLKAFHSNIFDVLLEINTYRTMIFQCFN